MSGRIEQILARDGKEQARALNQLRDILGESLKIQKNLLQETRQTNLILLELTKRLVPDGETDEEESKL